MNDWLVAVHAGAGRYGVTNEDKYLSLLRSALLNGGVLVARVAPVLARLAALRSGVVMGVDKSCTAGLLRALLFLRGLGGVLDLALVFLVFFVSE